GLAKEVGSLALSPNGRFLIFGGAHQFVLLWDIKENKERHRWGGNAECVHTLTFSPDSKLAVIGARKTHAGPGILHLWDTDTGRVVCALEGHPQYVFAAAFSP